MRVTLIVGVAVALGACNAAIPGAAISDGEAAKIAAEAEASFTGGNTQAIMSHYAPGATMFDPGTNSPSRDRAVQTKWTDALVQLKPQNFDAGKRVIQSLGPDAFISSGIASLEISTGQGMQAIHVRYTDVFKKQADGKWLIVHEHNSALPSPAAPL